MGSGDVNQLPDFIAETPFHAIMVGLLAIFVFGTVWLLGKKPLFLVLAIVSLVLTIGAVLAERWIVTDREQISAEVNAMAGAVSANSPTSLLLHISDRYPAIKDAARGHFNRWQIEFCNLTALEPPSIDWSQSPPQAEVRFTVFARAHQKQGDGLGGADIIGVTLQMQKEADSRWRVIGYSLFNPRGGPAPAY
jgi:hypothetical protein